MASAAQPAPAPSNTAQSADDVPRPPHERHASSFAVPPPMYSSLAEVSTAFRLLPASLGARSADALPPNSCFARPSGAAIRAALFADGRPRAAACFLLAVLANHVRRMLAPWLGAWVSGAPLADLKMAVGSPHYFLDELLGGSAWRAAGMVAQKGVVDLLGAAAARRIVAEARRGRGRSFAVEAARVGVLVWALAAAEYVQARTCNAVAVGIAVRKLVTGSQAHWEILGEVLVRHWMVVPVYAWWVVYYLAFGVGPLVLSAGGSAARGRPGLLGVIGATGYVTYVVTRWSNKYYIVLELWGFVMVVGWVVVGMLVLAGMTAMDILGNEEARYEGREGSSREAHDSHKQAGEGNKSHDANQGHSGRARKRA